MRVISHRGIGGPWPENSLPAFAWALKKGYGVELDVYRTADGKLIVSHDDDLRRLFGKAQRITVSSYQALRKYRYLSHPDVGLATFEEVCELFRELKPADALFCVQIKDMRQQGVVEETIAMMRRYGLPGFVFEVDERTWLLIEEVRLSFPSAKVALHLPEGSLHNDEASFRKADMIWADEPERPWLTGELAGMAHRLKRPVYVISPELIPTSAMAGRYRDRWKDFVVLDVDGICTDHPDELQNFLKSRRTT